MVWGDEESRGAEHEVRGMHLMPQGLLSAFRAGHTGGAEEQGAISLRFEICEVGWLPIVQHSPHEASSASTDVHEGVVLLFQATMAGDHSELVGLPSQLSALVLLQDSQLLRMEWPSFS